MSMFRRFLISIVASLAFAVPFAGLSYGQARTELTTSERRSSDAGGFPHLKGNYEVLSPATPNYNCIAWSLGITTKWVWPGDRVADFDQLNARFGYSRVQGLDFRVQPGVD